MIEKIYNRGIEIKNNIKSKGLGDTVEKITKATGIKYVANEYFDDCNCDKRKEKLNKLFPYKDKKNGI